MTLRDLYTKTYGVEPEMITPLTAAGSNRRYFRLTGEATVVGVEGTSAEENESFIYLDRHFHAKGLPVPELIATSNDSLCYLQEDLGDESLFNHRDNHELLAETIRTLPDFQFLGAQGLDFSKCYPVAEFDARCIMWDLNYFKYCFLNTTGVPYKEDLLEHDFRTMADRLGNNESDTFMYRDFQSRNVMIKDNKPYFIDFQGGRRGPVEYDVVSFLWQAKAGFPAALKDELIDEYIASATRYVEINPEKFRARLREFVLLRTLQVLGAYGFRGKFERKPHFLNSIPAAIENLRELLSHPFNEYPYLCSVLERMIASQTTVTETKNESSLTVTVTSFSYKKGIPDDPSGNGGGFVFDCRGMHNPGRYEEYKQLTGLDKPVIDFLEHQGEIQKFLDNCYSLVDPSVETYDRRGFQSLMVSFGCTGGRHRSVYGAQHLAEHIKQKYPHVNVVLNHREQEIHTIL